VFLVPSCPDLSRRIPLIVPGSAFDEGNGWNVLADDVEVR
jgi:hypothetical protein